jgi:hypothetical protein
MIDFDPRFTEVVYLDIECYVPPNARQPGRSSMIYNPAGTDHFILGGVFRREFPGQHKTEPAWHVWNWTKEDEKVTLQRIYDYMNESWRTIEGKTTNHPDLMLVGIGISRHDVPALYVRSAFHRIASETALYETYFKTKIVDLSDAGIGFFRNNPAIYPLYPKTANALAARFGIRARGIQGRKVSGKSVWDLYDLGQFDEIKERTASEVEDAIEIASKMCSGR